MPDFFGVFKLTLDSRLKRILSKGDLVDAVKAVFCFLLLFSCSFFGHACILSQIINFANILY